MHMPSPLSNDSNTGSRIQGSSTGTANNRGSNYTTAINPTNPEEQRDYLRAAFLPNKNPIIVKAIKKGAEYSKAALESTETLCKRVFANAVTKLKTLCDENNNNTGVKRSRELVMWATAGIATLTTISTAIQTITKVKRGDKNRANLVLSFMQIATGLTLSKHIVHTLTGRQGAGFNSVRTIMLGTGVYATLAIVNSLIKSDGFFSKMLKPFGISRGLHSLLGPNDLSTFNEDNGVSGGLLGSLHENNGMEDPNQTPAH